MGIGVKSGVGFAAAAVAALFLPKQNDPLPLQALVVPPVAAPLEPDAGVPSAPERILAVESVPLPQVDQAAEQLEENVARILDFIKKGDRGGYDGALLEIRRLGLNDGDLKESYQQLCSQVGEKLFSLGFQLTAQSISEGELGDSLVLFQEMQAVSMLSWFSGDIQVAADFRSFGAKLGEMVGFDPDSKFMRDLKNDEVFSQNVILHAGQTDILKFNWVDLLRNGPAQPAVPYAEFKKLLNGDEPELAAPRLQAAMSHYLQLERSEPQKTLSGLTIVLAFSRDAGDEQLTNAVRMSLLEIVDRQLAQAKQQSHTTLVATAARLYDHFQAFGSDEAELLEKLRRVFAE